MKKPNDLKENYELKNPYPVGKNVFIRTVTMYYTGKLVTCNPGELVLEDAAWVSEMGVRMSEFLKGQSKFTSSTEIEPFVHSVIIPRNAIIDVTEWEGELPKEPRG